ncbi:MAG TPA: hypothetical protein VF885_01625 [Arthrobacter sp.]
MSSAEIEELRALLEEVIRLRRNVKHAGTSSGGKIDAVRPRHRESALNLVHYAELRRHDIRDLQSRLAKYGLSSLGRTEAHVLPSIEPLIWTLTRLVTPGAEHTAPPAGFPNGGELLARNAVNLLGPKPEDRSARIMVTLPGEAAADPSLVRGMVERWTWPASTARTTGPHRGGSWSTTSAPQRRPPATRRDTSWNLDARGSANRTQQRPGQVRWRTVRRCP